MPKRVASLSLQKQIMIHEKKQQKNLILQQKQQIKLTSKITNFPSHKIQKQKSLDRLYFRQQVVELAKDLLGKVIIHQTQHGILKAVIVQTQAYKAPLDKGCHAYNNKKTQRTKYFWLDGGHLYVYTIYMPTNICINVVAGLQNQPEAVLIRAVQPIQGLQLIKSKRNIKSNKLQQLSNGPGKVGQCLFIDKDQMNGIDLVHGKLKIVDVGHQQFQIGISKRINIDYAAEWKDKLWRFYVKGNTYVSKVNPDAPPKIKKK